MPEYVVLTLGLGGTSAGTSRPRHPVTLEGDTDRRAHTREGVGTQVVDHLATQVVDHPAIRAGGHLVIQAEALVATPMTGTTMITTVTIHGGTGGMCQIPGDHVEPRVR